MKITKEEIAKHIINQTETSRPFDETKKLYYGLLL